MLKPNANSHQKKKRGGREREKPTNCHKRITLEASVLRLED
ncbi:16852_t:CDS:1, partial [Gigaspora rosea]